MFFQSVLNCDHRYSMGMCTNYNTSVRSIKATFILNSKKVN